MDFLQPIDLGALYWFRSWHRPWLDTLMFNLTTLGDAPVLAVLAPLLALALALTGRVRTASLFLGAVFLGAVLLGFVLEQGAKAWVDRLRPEVALEEWITRPDSGSFPSGHALNSMTVYGGFALLLGITRLYLGFHYLTDVLAGWYGGLACALLALWADRRWGEARPRIPEPVVTPARPAPDLPGGPHPEGIRSAPEGFTPGTRPAGQA